MVVSINFNFLDMKEEEKILKVGTKVEFVMPFDPNDHRFGVVIGRYNLRGGRYYSIETEQEYGGFHTFGIEEKDVFQVA